MKADYVNAYIKATSEVFKTIANVQLSIGKPFMNKNPFEAKEVIILVGITGDIRGQAVLSMDTQVAHNIASAMMMGMPVDELNEMSKSALSELGNMIMGNAATVLFNDGLTVDITPPTLMIGNNVSISSEDMKTIGIPLNSPLGEVSLNISVKE